MLFYGGIWATIFGFFLFGEAYGLHFALQAHELSWSSLLGLDIPNKLFGVIPIGIYDKLSDAKMLLFIAIWIGIVHIGIGLGLGFYNKAVRHGFKHAFMEKFSWLMILAGGAFLFPGPA